jgi:hypothetical protein
MLDDFQADDRREAAVARYEVVISRADFESEMRMPPRA